MTLNDLDSTSRLFVSGLPPSFSSQQLRNLFGERFSVTDAHVLSDRRIGFVGLEDHQAAKDAARYFNRSFIRMSKISVDLARPVDVKTNEQGQAAPVSQRALRSHVNTPTVSQRPQKRKRSREDEHEPLRSTSSRPADTSDGHQGRLDYDPGVEQRRNSTPPAVHQSQVSVPDGPETAVQLAPASDGDWLRAKTSRVLDLQDVRPEIFDPTTPIATMTTTQQPEHDRDIAEAAEPQESPQKPTETDTKLSTSRLFLRNLAFDASENDLRGLLSPFGKLLEVSLFSISLITLT